MFIFADILMMNFHDFAANWFTFSRHPLLFPGEEEWMHSKAYSVSCLEYAVSENVNKLSAKSLNF